MSNTDSKRLTQEQLSEILDLHEKWVREEPGGARANLSRANLSGANLKRANLEEANLRGANLSGANLSGANLSGANLSYANLLRADLFRADLFGANLSGANLSGANLSGASLPEASLSGASLPGADMSEANLSGASLFGANLSGANLSGADLSRANLSRANLSRANLSGAILRGAKLGGAKLEGAKLPPPILDLTDCKVGYKKVWNSDRSEQVVIELRFPEGAKLVSTVIGRKCRASEAVVVRCLTPGYENKTEFRSLYSERFIYRVGETVKPTQPFNDSITIECTSGIHFFTTREEAEEYNL